MENKFEKILNSIKTDLFGEYCSSVDFGLATKGEYSGVYVIHTYDADGVPDKFMTLTELLFGNNKFCELVDLSNTQDYDVITMNAKILYIGGVEEIDYDYKYEYYYGCPLEHSIPLYKMKLSIMNEEERVRYLETIITYNGQ